MRNVSSTFKLLVILLLLLLPSQFLMVKNKDIYPSHDGLIHIERIKEYSMNLKSGMIPPRVAPTLSGKIAYPLFVANYQLPYFFASIFYLSTNDAFFAIKSVLAITYILSAVFAFLLFKQFGGSSIASLCGSIIFSYLPYRFANIYTRAALGESVALMFVILVLLSMHCVDRGKKWSSIFFAFSLFGLICSHGVIFLLFLPFFVFYLIVILKIKNMIKKFSPGFFLGVSLSAFVLFPIFFERSYLKLDETFFNIFYFHFINIFSLFRIPVSGINLSTPFQIGIVSSVIFILGILFGLVEKNRTFLYFSLFALLGVFLTLKQSLWIWENIPFLNFIVYPWRFISLIGLCMGFLSVLIVDRINNLRLFAFFVIIMAIISSRHYFLKPTQYFSTAPLDIPSGPVEYDTVWSNARTFIPRDLVTSPPSANVYNIEDSLFSVSFSADSADETEITVRKLFFPGWKLKINNLVTNIKEKDGLISFNIIPGESNVYLYFEESEIRRLGNLISMLTFLGLVIYMILARFGLELKNAKS